MKIKKQTETKITVEFDILDLYDLRTFFEENKQAIDDTDSDKYQAIKKFQKLKISNSTYLNDSLLKRMNFTFRENEKMLKDAKKES